MIHGYVHGPFQLSNLSRNAACEFICLHHQYFYFDWVEDFGWDATKKSVLVKFEHS